MASYAMMRSQVEEWEKFVETNPWADEALQKTSWSNTDTPERCVAVYYVVDKDQQTITNKLHVVTWSSEYKREFKDLNLAWVQELYEVEESDIRQVEYPEENILQPGGEIFFLLEDNKVAGTVAMMIHDGECELGKMTISSAYQGRGYAHPLMVEGIAWARREGHPGIKLLTSVKLIKAVSLYERHGFEITFHGKHPDFDRCDCIMYLKL
ncbi:hypothetical protein DFQ30_011459 [Apophysomyces sp. BC1015]|nr:hypothetical protein DFQ30_011459 [Apophysomyces sp. BC1015]